LKRIAATFCGRLNATQSFDNAIHLGERLTINPKLKRSEQPVAIFCQNKALRRNNGVLAKACPLYGHILAFRAAKKRMNKVKVSCKEAEFPAYRVFSMTPFQFGFWIFGKTYDEVNPRMKGYYQVAGRWYLRPSRLFWPAFWS
jgi:hypothetical protein